MTRAEAYILAEQDEDEIERRITPSLVCPSWVNHGREAGCSDCRDIGWTSELNDPSDERSGAHAASCHCQAQLRGDLRVSGIVGEKMAREINFDSWRMDWPDKGHNRLASLALTAAIRWAQGSDPPWLVLNGKPGCGKTYLAIASCRRMAELGIDSAYYRVADLLVLYKAAIGNEDFYGQKAQTARERTHSVTALVLDDLGQERGTSYNQDEIETVLAHRWARGMQTCITTNGLTNLSPRMMSRMKDKAMLAAPDLEGTQDVRAWLRGQA